MTGSELKKWREDWGLTQVRLAALLGIKGNTISMWENERRRIPPRSERAIRHLIEHVEQTKALQEMILDWDSRIENALNAPQLKKMALSTERLPNMKNVERILRELERILRRVNVGA